MLCFCRRSVTNSFLWVFQDGDYSYQGADGHAQVYDSGSKKHVNGYASSDVASEGQRPKYIKTLYKHGSGVGS